MRGREHALLVRRRRRAPSATRRSTSRCSATAASTTGLDGGDAAPHAVGRSAPSCRRSTTTSGSSTTRAPTGRQAHDLAAEHPRSSHELQRLLARSRRASTTSCRSTTAAIERFNPDLAGRPDADQGQHAAAVRRHGPADRELGASTSRTSRTRSPPRSTCPTAARTGVIIAQGGAFAGWSLYAHERQAEVLLQPARPPALHDRGRHGRSLPATHQVRMEFAYDGGGLGQGRQRRRSTSTASRSARAGSSARSR